MSTGPRSSVETFAIVIGAAGLAASVVWWASSPRSPRPQTPRPRRTPARPIRFRDTFTTAPAVREIDGGDGWVALPSPVPDDRPSPIVALARLALAITVVGALAVGAMAGLWLLVRSQLGG